MEFLYLLQKYYNIFLISVSIVTFNLSSIFVHHTSDLNCIIILLTFLFV